MKGSQASDDATGSLGPGRLQLPAMRVLVAPDCYGDSLSAVEAAAAIELDAAAGRGVSAEPGAGAAGGIGAGLLAVGGRYQSGAAIIAEHTHFADDLADAELIVTGEGRFDEQSLHGKVVGAIAAAARPLAIPVIVLAGQVSLDKSALRSAGIMAALSIAEYAGSVRLALADAANQLMGLASQVAARLGNSGPSGYR